MKAMPLTDLNIKSDRTSGNIGGVNFVDSSNAIKGQVFGNVDGTVRIFSGGQTQALLLDASQNATFAGTISSGAITSSGDIRANGGDYFTNSGAAGNYRGFGDRLGLSIVNGASYIYDAASTPIIALAAYQGNIHIYNELKMGNLSGVTVIDSSRNLTNIASLNLNSRGAAVSVAKTFSLPNTSGNSGRYIKLGTISSFSNSGHTLVIRIHSNAGYNASDAQNQECLIRFKTSNNSSNQSGFYGDCQTYNFGARADTPSDVIVKQVSSTEFEFYGIFQNFTGNSSIYTVEHNSGVWTNSGTDTGTSAPTGTTLTATKRRMFITGDNNHNSALDIGTGTISSGNITASGTDAQILATGDNTIALHQDAAWRSNIYFGAKHDGSNEVYGATGRGAFKFQGQHDSNGSPQFLAIYGADQGTAGNTISWNTVGFAQDEDGNVGIGLTSPSEKLHIASSAADHLTLKLEQDNASYESWFEANSQDGGYFRAGISTNASNYAFFNTDQASYRWFGAGGGSPSMTLTNGNLGLGTTSPSSTLHLANSSGVSLRLEDTGSHNFRMVCENGVNSLNFKEGSGNTILSLEGSNRRVGIGTTSPATPLHVKTNSSGYALTVEENSGGEQYQIGTDSFGGLNFFNSGTKVAEFTDSSEFQLFSSGAVKVKISPLNHSYINSGFNFGIGTTSPSATLSVDKNTANQHRALDLENNSITYSMYVDQDNNGSNSWSIFDTTNSQTALRYLPSSSGNWQFYTNGTERMRITSSGETIFKPTGSEVGRVTSSGFTTTGSYSATGNFNTSLGGYQVGGQTVITSARNIENISQITASGQISGGTLKTDLTHDGFFGGASFSWGGNSGYPTLYGGHADRWVMITFPHIPYLTNGVNGFTGTTRGATMRMASNPSASAYWDVGVSNTTEDLFRIGRAGSNALEINSSLNSTFAGTISSGAISVTTTGTASGTRTPFYALHSGQNTIQITQFGQSHATAPAVNQIGVSNAEQHLHLVTDTSANVAAGGSTKGIFLRSGGNVGIGTQSPAFTNGSGLEIERSGTSTLRIRNASSGHASEIFQSTAFTIADLSSGTISFRVSNTERMTLDSTGLAIGNSSVLTRIRSLSNSGFTDTAIENFSSGAYRERLRFSGQTILAGITSSVGVGGTPADADSIELGRGYINLARDDTANAKQITFGKNGSVHSSIETTTSEFRINSAVNTHNFMGTTYAINGFDVVKFTNSGGVEIGDLEEDDRDVTIRAFANTAKITMTDGSVAITGALSKSSGSFKIDHPLKPETHDLVHSFVEGPQADNLYRGVIKLENGRATIDLDEWFGMTSGTFLALNRDIQAFVNNSETWDAVRAKIMGSQLIIECQNPESSAEVSWLVIGERQDKEIHESSLTNDEGKIIVEPLKEGKIFNLRSNLWL